MGIWDKFEKVVNGVAFDLFYRKEIIWYRLSKNLDPHGEGHSNRNHIPVILKCLLEYNTFRIWPIDTFTPAGQTDRQYVLVILNKQYLRKNGWLNEDDYFAFNSGRDYFKIDGIEYEDAGDTNVSQSDDSNLLFYLILKRKEYKTGEKVHDIFRPTEI